MRSRHHSIRIILHLFSAANLRPGRNSPDYAVLIFRFHNLRLKPQEHLERQVPACAVGHPRANNAGVGVIAIGKAANRGQIALQIATGNPQAWSQIGIQTDALIKLECRDNLRPIRADSFAHFCERIGHTHGRHQAHIDGNFGKLCALVAHRQDGTAKACEKV